MWYHDIYHCIFRMYVILKALAAVFAKAQSRDRGYGPV